MQHRGVNVGDIVAILYGVETQFICRPVDETALDPAAGHPGGELKRKMIAPALCGGIVRPDLNSRRSAEFGSPDDERVIQLAPVASDL